MGKLGGNGEGLSWADLADGVLLGLCRLGKGWRLGG